MIQTSETDDPLERFLRKLASAPTPLDCCYISVPESCRRSPISPLVIQRSHRMHQRKPNPGAALGSSLTHSPYAVQDRQEARLKGIPEHSSSTPEDKLRTLGSGGCFCPAFSNPVSSNSSSSNSWNTSDIPECGALATPSRPQAFRRFDNGVRGSSIYASW